MKQRVSGRRMAWFGVGCMIFWGGLAPAQTGADKAPGWPKQWVAFGPVAAKPGVESGSAPTRAALLPGAALKTIPASLEIGGARFEARPVTLDPDCRIDLNALFGGEGRGRMAYLLAPLRVERDTTLRLGAGADWFMQWWLDGEPIFDTLATGNRKGPIAADNHVLDLLLRKGEHVLAVAVISGSGGFLLAAGDPAHRPAVPTAYAEAMAAGRAPYGGHWSAPLDFGAARREFQRAADAATTDVQRAEALLAFGRASLADLRLTEYAPVRDACERVIALPKATTQQRASAHLAIAETWLKENKIAAAREACEKATSATRDARFPPQAQWVLARCSAQVREYPRARSELDEALGMEKADGFLKQQAAALRAALVLLPRLRAERPRLFFNDETWPAVRERALTAERERFEGAKSRAENLPANTIRPADWGMQAMEAAFVWRITGDLAVLAKVRAMLRATVDHWRAEREFNAYSHSRIGWLAALDWVWNDLAPAERAGLAADMLDYLSTLYAEDEARGKLRGWPHYYEREVHWYGGLALFDPDADDITLARALTLLAEGYRQNREAIGDRLNVGGDDGTWQVNLGYSLAMLPTSHAWDFLYTWRSALGLDIPDNWLNIGVPPDYALRVVLALGRPAHRVYPETWADGRLAHFGYSRTCAFMRADLLYDHLAQFMHFFGARDPDHAAVARHLQRRIGDTLGRSAGEYPVFRFLMTDLDEAGPSDLPADLPVARHFEGVGQVLMSSGFSSNDTYALFIVGGGKRSPEYTTASCHMDAAHFSIYRRGYLALDSGVEKSGASEANYYNQTVAHNAVLIRMPGETFPGAASNGGGQRNLHTLARPLAFESDRLYAYAATDVAPTYHEDKCARMVRQLLFLPPAHFLVFDRVSATKAEYPKTWLLHTANEPRITGREFQADQGEGRLFCRTLLPADAALEPIGGPGREFWADGKNWPIPDSYQYWGYVGMQPGGEVPEHAGRWRVEVTPGAARTDDCFLHLIQTADPATERMADSRVSETEDTVTVEFSAGPRAYTVTFQTRGEVGGRLVIRDGDREQVNRPLADAIMPQAGLALMK